MRSDQVTPGKALKSLTGTCSGAVELRSGDSLTGITAVEYDSRKVARGSLFVAVEGFQSDGHRFVDAAVRQGASAVCISGKRAAEFEHLGGTGVAVLVSDETRKALSLLSSAFYGNPSGDMTLIGITGTNGKTSTTYMLEAIFREAGISPGVIGTVNYRWADTVMPAPNTTPESKDLHELLFLMKRDGVKAAVMEVSSHALALNRVDGMDYDIAVFTNLTRDHLDFHRDFEDYFQAKKNLFSLLDTSAKKRKSGIVNMDDEYGRRLLEDAASWSYPVYSFGMTPEADYTPDTASIINAIAGLSYVLIKPVSGIGIKLKLAGKFHVYNSLAAVAVARCAGLSFEDITRGLGSLETVPGRFDVLPSGRGYDIIVDYAHTSDALLKLLLSVKELGRARIITLFGCGGDRDRTKRPLMGKTAEDYSDVVIVTSDNPRTEEPAEIIREITAGMTRGRHEVIEDRESAIRHALAMAREGDIVVIAGKGHEDYQIIGTKKIHFDDRELVRKHLGGEKAS